MQSNRKSKVKPGCLMIAKIAEEKNPVICIFQELTFATVKDWLFFLGFYFFRFPGSRKLLKILRYFFADREKKRKKAKCPNVKSITSKHLVANGI